MGISGLVHAGLTTSSGVENFNGSASVSATATSQLSASNSNNNASVANVSLGQFDSTLGVLTGVDLQLNSNRSQTISGSGAKGNGPGRTANGSGTSTASLSASGFSAAFAPAITQAGSGCSLAQGMTGSISCSWGPEDSPATATAGSVSSSNLNDYVGNGTVDAALTTPDLSATATLTTTRGMASSSTLNYSVSWQGSLEAVDSYLLHASASFDGSASQNSLTLDFGTILQNSAASSLHFSIFNLADVNRTGLDLDGFSGSGDTNIFNTGLAGFKDLAQGGSNGFIASMLTDTLGAFTASYLLDLSDADFGASSTWQNQTLTLNLVGEVVPVPVPAAVWLFSSALIGLIGSRRAGQAV